MTAEPASPSLPPASARPSFQTYLSLRLGLAAAMPLLGIVLLLQWQHARQMEAEYSKSIGRAVSMSGQKLDLFLGQTQAAIEVAAGVLGALGGPGDPQAGVLLKQTRMSNPMLTSMLVTDARGAITASDANPNPVPSKQPDDGNQVADRVYFQFVMRENRSYVSGGFWGRGFGDAHIAAIASPIRGANGKPIGIVEGSILLSSLAQLDPFREHPDMMMLIVDQEAKLVYASPKAKLDPLQPLASNSMLALVAKADPAQAIHLSAESSAMESDALLARWPLPNGWQVLVVRRLGSLSEQRRQLAYITLALLLLAAIATVIVTRLLVHSVAEPVNLLANLVGNFTPGQHAAPQAPAGAPKEVEALFLGFAKMSQRLNGTIAGLQQSLTEGAALRAQLQQSLAERERVIEARTQELSERARELMASNFTLEQNMGIDALTGVANRRGFDEGFANAWRHAVRNAQPISVIMMDIDHFKRYNDYYGHLKGDACLIEVAAAAQSMIRRPGDFFARYGGEEFVAVLMQTDVNGARILAESMRQAVRALAIKNAGAGDGVIVTASFGVASCTPDAMVKSQNLVAYADDALYQAKRDGRDRVHAHLAGNSKGLPEPA